MIRASRSASAAASARTTPATSLSAIDAVRSVIGGRRRTGSSPPVRNGRRSSRATARAAAPAGLWAPSRSTSRPSTSEQLEATRPARRREPGPAGVRWRRCDPGRGEGVQRRVRRPPRWRPGGARAARPASARGPARSRSRPSRRISRMGAGAHLRQRHAEPTRPAADDRQRVAGRAGHREVAALDDRRLLPGDVLDRRSEAVHVVEVHVGHDRHAAVPGVRRVEAPTQTHLDERDVHARPRRTTGTRRRSGARTRSDRRAGGRPDRRSA